MIKKIPRILIAVIVGIVLLVFVRAQFIYMEGPEIVKRLEDYYKEHQMFPATLKDVDMSSSLLFPEYRLYTDGYKITYVILPSFFWQYDSGLKQWRDLNS